jgi:SAM-dependent methyltransferase
MQNIVFAYSQEQCPNVRCPACLGSKSRSLEMIFLQEVHGFYSKSHAVRQELTRLAGSDPEPYKMRKCADCGLEFADPFRAPPSAWYDAAYSVLSLYPCDRWEFKQVLARCGQQDLIGEIGCGSGEFLKMCRIAGVQAVGVDFSENAINQCTSAGLQAAVLDVAGLSGAQSPAKDRDWVVAFHVLEHLDDPDTMFAIAACWMKSSGRLFLAVPSDQRPSRQYCERDFLDQPPHHMTRWSPAALEAIGQRNGWKMVSLAYEPMSMRAKIWSVTVRLKVYQVASSYLPRFCEPVLRLLLLPLAAFRLFRTQKDLSSHAMLAEYEMQSLE